MPSPRNNGKPKCSPLLCLMILLSTQSCASTTERSDVAANPLGACPTPIFPSDAAWGYRDSLPRNTTSEAEFRDWTARVLVQQTLLEGR